MTTWATRAGGEEEGVLEKLTVLENLKLTVLEDLELTTARTRPLEETLPVLSLETVLRLQVVTDSSLSSEKATS